MRKIAFSMALAALLFILVPAFAVTTPAKQNPVISTSEKPAGFYDIFVFKGDQWQHAGILEYNKYLREKKIDLSSFLPAEGAVRIRLSQHGGGAAHIDTVLLGGVPPSNIAGSEDKLALKKILKRDFDVLDAFEKSLEFNFAGNYPDTTLKITARVEPEIISKTPFQFPAANLFLNQSTKTHIFIPTPSNRITDLLLKKI